MYPWIKTHPKGTILNLYIQPGASSTEVSGEHGDRLKIKVNAPPRDGEANEAVVEFVAGILKIPKGKVFLIRGESSRSKDLLAELPSDKVSTILKELLK